MPDYKVTTDKGVFKVTLDKPPASDAELQQLVEEQLSGQSGATKPETKIEQSPSLARRAAMAPFEFMIPPGMRESSIGKMIANTGASSLLPMIGEAAGAASPIPGGAMAGSGLGEAANQLLGITEPSKVQLGLSTVAPGFGKLAGKGLNLGAEYLAKTFAGRDVMSEAAESLLKKWLSPKIAASGLYDIAQTQAAGVVTPSSQTGKAVDAILSKEIRAIPTDIRNEIISAVKPLEDFFYSPAKPAQTIATGLVNQSGKPIMKTIAGTSRMGPMAVDANEMMSAVHRLRVTASRALESDNVDLYRSLNQIRSSMLNDLENSGVDAIKQASKAYRKEMALEDLGKLMGKPHPLQKFHDFMKDNSLFKGAFSSSEIAQIERIAKKMGEIPASGGHGVMGKILTGGAGFEIGGWPGMIMGLAGPAAIRKILESPFGRNYAERIMAGSPTMTPEIAAALATFARGLMAKAPQPQQAAQ